MIVAQVIPRMDVGGVERGVLDQVRYFKDKGIKNIVISGGGRLVEPLNREGAIHYRMAVYKKSPSSFFLIFPMRKMINKDGIDIIHARSRVPGWISFFASRITNAHFITTAHGMYKSRFMSEVMGWGKFVICPSKVVARHMKDVFGVPEDKIVIINRWVDSDTFKFIGYSRRKESNTVVSIGRISPSKGYEYLIEGFKKVVRSNPYLKLKIIGSADPSKQNYLNHLKTLVSRYSLGYNVEFMGFRSDVENALKDARMLVAPSVIEESFGRTIVEAFACGVPVVASRVGAYQEIIRDADNGILVEPRSGDEIAAGMLKLLRDHQLAQKLVDNAKKDINNYAMDKSLERLKSIYEKSTKFFRILVIKISSFGDIILALPSLKEIKERFPESKVSLLTLNKYSSFLYGCPYVDEVITLNDDYKKFKNILSVSKLLRRKSFDYIIDLQNNKASHFISFLTFSRYSFGYSLRYGFLLNRKVKYNHKDDPLASQERILKLLGITLKNKELIFWDQKEEVRFPLPQKDLIGINISASKQWESKNWPTQNIIRLIEAIYKNLPSTRVVLIGAQEAKLEASKIENILWPRPINLCGKTTLKDLSAIIKRLNVFITPDTATLHLACALKIPTIALFGPTDPARHTVKSDDLFVFCKKIGCSFCYKAKCKQTEKNICMNKISPQDVFLKIKEILNK